MKTFNHLTKLTIALLIGAIVFSGCEKDRLTDDEPPTDSFSSMDAFYDKNKQEEQEFIIDSGGTGPIVGKMGTKLYVSKDIFMYSNGSDIDWPYTIKLIELYPIKDMILYNLPTVAGGKIMESAAEIRVRAFKDTDELVLKPGKSYYMELDTMQNILGNMEVFYGFASGSITDWTNDVTTISSTITTDNISSVTTNSYFYTMTVAMTGWVNCGKNYNPGGTETSVTFTAEGSGTEFIDIFLSFTDIKSVMQAYSLKSGKIPVGTNLTVIAFAMDQNNDYRLHKGDITVSSSQQITLDLKVTTESDLLSTLDGL